MKDPLSLESCKLLSKIVKDKSEHHGIKVLNANTRSGIGAKSRHSSFNNNNLPYGNLFSTFPLHFSYFREELVKLYHKT